MKRFIDKIFGSMTMFFVILVGCLFALTTNMFGWEDGMPIVFFGTVLAADKAVEYTEGVELAFPVINADIIYGGALVCVNAAGYAVPGDDATGLIFEGVAMERADNHAGNAGDISVNVRRRGLFKMTLGTAISIANVGDNVFIVDDQTVDLTAHSTYDIFCGVIAGYIDSTHAWIDIEPAIRQADVATHLADTSGAHAASAVSIADVGMFTSAAEVEAALQELYQNAISVQGFVPIKLTDLREVGTMAVGNIAAACGVLGSDTTPLLKPINGATDGCQNVEWVETGVDPVMFQVALPPDLDDDADLVIHHRIKSAGTTDAVGFTVDSWFNEGDTKVTDTSETNQTATWAEKITTIAAADVPAGAQTLTVSLTPVAHTTDHLYLSALWLEYKTKIKTS
jgi:hypothetical protein